MTSIAELLPEVAEALKPVTVLHLKKEGGRYKRKTFQTRSDAQRFVDACLDQGWVAAKFE